MVKKIIQLLLFFIINAYIGFAENFSIQGRIIDFHTQEPIPYVQVFLKNTKYFCTSDTLGNYILKNIESGSYSLNVSVFSYESSSKEIILDKDLVVDFKLKAEVLEMDVVTIAPIEDTSFGIKRLRDIEGTSIYAGKKNEVIVMKDLNVNTATNNSRQIYSKVPGLNIWESDGAGIQLGIGGRGLNPNRTSNFNTRQNGYDISADALGYPESYYSPPTEAVERIEIVRGAASLQYGTQFGGFINFKLKKGNKDKPFELISRQTIGSFGFINSFNSVGGTVKKLNYYAYYQHKRGNGWRPNSEFNVNTTYGALTYQVSDKFSLTTEYTFMHYLAHQPGGLTDDMFEDDPTQSLRARNWFKVNWNLLSVSADYRINNRLKFNTRFFGLLAGRDALGLLISPNREDDPETNRDLWVDKYRNWGNESRLLYTYEISKENLSAFVIGFRYYNGFTDRKQGVGNKGATGKKSDFTFANPDELEYSDYDFPSNNTALFVENIFRFSSKFSVTPGIRFENIQTNAKGFYNDINRDFAGNIIQKIRTDEERSSSRSFILGGIGFSYEPFKNAEVYANVSQNYRSINFNDMRIINPNVKVDQNLKDEKGYTADLGMRGNIKNVLNYDFGVFLIAYNNRIGSIFTRDTTTFQIYRYRTNVSVSRNIGFESFAELNFWRLIKGPQAKARISIFSNFSILTARYIKSEEKAYQNKKVELVPDIILKTGLTYKLGVFSATYQFSYTSEQYTDATNADETPNGIIGLIPAYYIMDFTVQYSYKRFTLSSTLNNITNNYYFTRRAEGYPGPGIIPSDPRSFYFTLQVKI